MQKIRLEIDVLPASSGQRRGVGRLLVVPLEKNAHIGAQGLESSTDILPALWRQSSRVDHFADLRNRANELGTTQAAQRHSGSPDPFLIVPIILQRKPKGNGLSSSRRAISRNLVIRAEPVLPQLGDGKDPELLQT
ncbi:MAG: hypothetical protein ABS59_09415 [Methylobacterium sp. SCN 67-24]|nr:MAG: hypothetical protein ABS59_09415 [Methylobacterium sp. SCN 67-24]